jgi:hypothetical protein
MYKISCYGKKKISNQSIEIVKKLFEKYLGVESIVINSIEHEKIKSPIIEEGHNYTKKILEYKIEQEI